MPKRSSSPPKAVRLLGVLCILILLLSSLLSACNLPTQFQQPGGQDAIMTSVAATLQADAPRLTLQAQEQLLTAQALTLQAPPSSTDIPQLTYTPLPTFTPLPTYTPVPTFTSPPTATWTPEGPPRIVATVDTNCRLGPQAEYTRLGFLLTGQESTVHGRNDSGTWWYIANPNRPGEYCWVWTETTVVTGDTSTLPIITPPPPPAPAFQANFSLMHLCGGVATLVFQVKNTGGKVFRSSSITIKDLSTNTFISGPETSNDPFYSSATACSGAKGRLDPGESAFVSKGLGFTLAANTPTRAIIILCTENDQGGECVEVKVNFDFP
ncbi:MAG: hypothetical protein AB1894_25925 [Chloroflexota bacterium]